MLDSVANLLLRIRGDTGDAKKDVAELTGLLKEFDNTDAEATAEVQTKKARAELDALRADLAKLSRETANPSVDVDIGKARDRVIEMQAALSALDLKEADPSVQVKIAKAMAELGVLKAMIDTVDGDDIEIDVKVRKDLVSRMNQVVGAVGSVTKGIGELGKEAEAVAGGGGGGGGMTKMTTNLGPFGVSGAAGAAAAGLVGLALVMGGALAAALAAMIASLALAVTALAAVGVAALVALGPIGLFVAGAIGAFKHLSTVGGQVAVELKRAWSETFHTFQQTFGDAARPLFRSFTSMLREIRPFIEQMKGPLKDIGLAFNDAFKGAFADLKSEWPTILSLMSQVGPLIQAAVPFAVELFNLFLEIANLALPLLVTLLGKAKNLLNNIRQTVANSATSGGFAAIVSQLQSWLNLIKQVSNVFINFFKAAGPAGQQFVDWLAQGAQKLSDWLSSTDGQNTLAKFFQDVIPLAEQTINLIANLIVLFFQIVQTVAPALTTVVAGFNAFLNAVIAVVQWLMPMLQFLEKIAVIVGSVMVLGIFALIGWLVKLLGGWDGVWNAIEAGASAVASALSAAWNAIKSAASATWNALKSAASAAWNAIKSATSAAWNAIKAVVVGAVNAVASAVSAAWNAIRSATSAVWNGIKSYVSGAVNAIKSYISTGASVWKSAATTAWHAISSAATTAWETIKSTVSSGISAVVGIVKGAAGAFLAAGKALMEALAHGIESAASAPFNAVKSVVGKVRGLLPFSDAKEGPLSNLTASGKSIPETLAEGIRQGAPAMITAISNALDELSIVVENESQASQTNIGKLQERLQALQSKLGEKHSAAFGAEITSQIKSITAEITKETKAADVLNDTLTRTGTQLSNLKDFQSAIMGLGDSLSAAADKGVASWAELRKELRLAAIDASPQGQQLAGLIAARSAGDHALDVTHSQEKIGDLQQHLSDLQTELDNPGRTRSIAAIQSEIVTTTRAIRDAQHELDNLNTDKQITDLQDIIDAQKNFVEQRFEQEKEGRGKEAQAYKDSLMTQLDALRAMLAQGKISYDKFVKEVTKILGPLGVTFEVSDTDEVALRAGRSFIRALIKGMQSAQGEAKKALQDILKDLRDMLPGSEPKDPSSPLRGLSGAGEAAMSNLADGLRSQGKAVASALAASLAPIANLGPTLVPAVAGAPGAGAGGSGGVNVDTLERHYHLPPGPGGGYEPMYAASQLDQLLQNEGGF